MGLLIATVFAVFAVAEARHHPSVELYEIRDQSETRSKNHEPVLQRINKLDSKTDAAAIVKYITKYLTLLKPGHSESNNEDKSENEGGFVDETRSSIVVVPGDKDILNNM
ncbi:hypothetical protein MSG28_004331 [Choristoneura fumiferana]|uniref:Uncharacterized protein n=1 Tax=Choristoneura fumiferana TaxID=7141 RepID=A0ACC0KIA9_CHOFU|nr:hypothetical protein MSG28_004331 [Choristoneura fumiferana]